MKIDAWMMQQRPQFTEWGLKGGEVVLDLRYCFPDVINLSFCRGQRESFQLSPLSEAKLCTQNEFIIWGSALLRGKETRSYSWKRINFLSPPERHLQAKKAGPDPAKSCLYSWWRPAHEHNSTHLRVFLKISRATLNASNDGWSLCLCLLTPHIPRLYNKNQGSK